jgi:VWFA-related protein
MTPKSHPRTLILTIIALLVFAAVPGRTPAQTDVEVLRIKTELVVIDAQVLNKKSGQIVGGLQASDFQIYEDGVKQEPVFFSQDKLPLSLVLLFDLTDTVRPVLQTLAAGALQALKHLKPEDEVAVMTYAASTQLLQDFTTDRALVVNAIEKASLMESNEAAFFNEGVFQGAAQLAKAKTPSSRRVIIWLTDNQPNIPSEKARKRHGSSVPKGELHTEKDAFREVFESDTVVAGLLARSLLSTMAEILYKKNPLFAISRRHHPPGDVYKYARETGGEVVSSGKEEVSSRLAELIDHLRTRYTLGYRPSNPQPDGKFCKLKLSISNTVEKREGKVAIRTRSGYYRGGNRPLPRPVTPTLKSG